MWWNDEYPYFTFGIEETCFRPVRRIKFDVR